MMLDVGLVRSFLESNGRIAIPLDTRQSQTPTTFHMGKGELGREKLGGGRCAGSSFRQESCNAVVRGDGCEAAGGAEQGSAPRCHRN